MTREQMFGLLPRGIFTSYPGPVKLYFEEKPRMPPPADCAEGTCELVPAVDFIGVDMYELALCDLHSRWYWKAR